MPLFFQTLRHTGLKLKYMENTNLPAPQEGKELMYLLLMQQAAASRQDQIMYHRDDQNRQDDKIREDRAQDKQNQFYSMMFLFLVVFLFGFAAILMLSKIL